MTGNRIRLGIDLGGTKTEIVALDPAGRALLRRRVATPQGDYDATLAARGDPRPRRRARASSPRAPSASARRARSRARPACCAAPTPSASTAGRSGRDLEAALGREVRITNDANCFALSEASDGAGQGAGSRVRRDPRHRRRGRHRRRRPGARGRQRDRRRVGPQPAALAARRRAARPGLLLRPRRLHRDLARRPRARARSSRTRPGRRSRRRTSRCAPPPGDAACDATLARYEERLARALAHVINLLDPDVIVLGGGMSNVARLYDAVPARWGTVGVLRSRRHPARPPRPRRLERRARRGVAVAGVRHRCCWAGGSTPPGVSFRGRSARRAVPRAAAAHTTFPRPHGFQGFAARERRMAASCVASCIACARAVATMRRSAGSP